MAGGTTFEQCHVTAASCAPARASLFTGYYPHSTGILKNADDWTRSWVEVLANEGAITARISAKCTHGLSLRLAVSMNVMSLKTKIDFLKVLNLRMSGRVICKMRASKNKGVSSPKRDDYEQSLGAFAWEQAEDSHSDFFTGNKAIQWLENYKSDQPFFLEIGFPGPHPRTTQYPPIWNYIMKLIYQ